MAKMILSDGVQIDGLSINGNNVVSKDEIRETIFKGKLSPLVVRDDEGNEVLKYDNAVLVQQVHYENMPGLADGWYLNFRDMTTDELTQINNDEAIVTLYEMLLGGE